MNYKAAVNRFLDNDRPGGPTKMSPVSVMNSYSGGGGSGGVNPAQGYTNNIGVIQPRFRNAVRHIGTPVNIPIGNLPGVKVALPGDAKFLIYMAGIFDAVLLPATVRINLFINGAKFLDTVDACFVNTSGVNANPNLLNGYLPILVPVSGSDIVTLDFTSTAAGVIVSNIIIGFN